MITHVNIMFTFDALSDISLAAAFVSGMPYGENGSLRFQPFNITANSLPRTAVVIWGSLTNGPSIKDIAQWLEDVIQRIVKQRGFLVLVTGHILEDGGKGVSLFNLPSTQQDYKLCIAGYDLQGAREVKLDGTENSVATSGERQN